LYPLGLALLGERVPEVRMARANACYLASNCAGSLCGPLLFGVVIDLFGLASQFLLGMGSVVFVLGLWAVRAAGGRQAERTKSPVGPLPTGSDDAGEGRRMAA
jgi:MFS family permease